MLETLKELKLTSAKDATKGDVQTLLQRLLIEVISANYRYFLHERMTYAADNYEQPETYCWPPLLANERQVSGLFAHALSSVCPVSRPEMGITRTRVKQEEDERSGEAGAGRIDYFATHGQRSVALELKRTTTSTIAKKEEWSVLKHQWNVVGTQAESALVHMRRERFPYAVSIGLLVVRISRAAFTGKDLHAAREEAAAAVRPIAENLRTQLKPDFLAVYKPPSEMQVSYGWGKDETRTKIFPGVVFAATVRIKQPRRK